eukprot:TRINITY_DN12032_c0_g1_i3.p1 TRINITY_DN12032_c0_g1~~TRINITY_DN12032_c0_g1_i3.p1  ORF type:complete len:597 (+),score=144.04 TRINITY_DN12032_c0_g1_i3:1153-2943(+)
MAEGPPSKQAKRTAYESAVRQGQVLLTIDHSAWERLLAQAPSRFATISTQTLLALNPLLKAKRVGTIAISSATDSSLQQSSSAESANGRVPSSQANVLKQALTASTISMATQTEASEHFTIPRALGHRYHPFAKSPHEAASNPELMLHPPALTTMADQSQLADTIIHSNVSVVVVRDYVRVSGLNTKLFDPRRLARRAPGHAIDLRKQRVSLTTPERNTNADGEQEWRYLSQPSTGTLKEYVDYMEGWMPQPDADSYVDVVFGTNLDLDDPATWQAQLQELRKCIPADIRWDAAPSLLSQMQYTIPGMSGVQLYLKVFGCRTPAHQENNCLASVNINLGPGPVVWWTVAAEHADTLRKLCQQRDIDFDRESWWPSEADLKAADIPFRRFVQHPGDFVWVGYGCVHWVQSLSTTVAVSYNVGPLTAQQYMHAWASYQRNLTTGYQSLVPMKRITLALARSGLNLSCKLRQQVYYRLREVLADELRMLDALTAEQAKLGVLFKMELLAHAETEQHWYCHGCGAEAFNVMFAQPQANGQHHVVCYTCRQEWQRKQMSGVLAKQSWWARPHYQYTPQVLAAALRKTASASNLVAEPHSKQ